MHVDAIYERRESVPVLVMPYRQGCSTGPAPGRVGSGRKYHVMRGRQGRTDRIQCPDQAPASHMDHVRCTNTLTLGHDATTRRRMINQYVVDSELGRGVFGSVKLAHDVTTSAFVAIKIVQREAPRRLGVSYVPRQTDERVLREIIAMSRCRHPNVVQLYEVIDDPRSRKLFLVTEYLSGGALAWRDALTHTPVLTCSETRRVIRDVVHGLAALHRCGVIHRDLKPANILCTEHGEAKISDFGSAYVRETLGSADALSSTTDPILARTAGTPAFFAPELCYGASDGPPITKAMDVWALGVTLYCLLFGRVPFDAETEYLLLESILHDDYAVPTHMGSDRVLVGPRPARWPSSQETPNVPLSGEAHAVRHLLDALLDKDPATRLTLDRVITHPWLVAESW